jgi:predicted S18 family serine protease
MALMKILKLVGGSIIDKPLEIIDNQLKFYQQRKNAKNDQKLRQEEAKFMQQLDMDRQKFNAELDDMIARREIERGSLIAQTIADYQKTMAECTISIGKSLGMMNIELRERATALVEDKQKQYSALQDAAMDKASAQLEKIYAKFPEESKARSIMENAVEKQLNNIIETSDRFMRTIDEDFSKMMDSVRQITENTMNNAGQYISPGFANNAMLRGSGDTKYLK